MTALSPKTPTPPILARRRIVTTASSFYDDVYFDSDEEEQEQKERSLEAPAATNTKSQRSIVPHDDLLYDPTQDDADEEWVANKIKATPQHHTQKVATTDAILTCPMCFSPLCYSCQRHDTYPNQYRAMFVENCHVIRTERYKVAAHATPLKNRGKRKGTAVVEDEKEEEEKGTAALEAYFCVQCKTCKTHVAMMDDDEVYHFFNAIAQ